MTSSVGISPREFGRELLTARQGAGVTLELISARTKIGRRALEALENGEYAQLPDRVFAGFFVRQYLDMVGISEKAEWLDRFEQSWHFHHSSSQPVPAVQEPLPAPRRRIRPWVIGFVLVVGALAAVILIERRHTEVTSEGGTPALPTPVSVRRSGTVDQPPEDTGSTPEEGEDRVPRIPDTMLWLRALDHECWVEVVAAPETSGSRLLKPGEVWEVEVGPGPVELLIGDAAGVEFSYRGQTISRPGRAGQVMRFRLDGTRSEPVETR